MKLRKQSGNLILKIKINILFSKVPLYKLTQIVTLQNINVILLCPVLCTVSVKESFFTKPVLTLFVLMLKIFSSHASVNNEICWRTIFF